MMKNLNTLYNQSLTASDSILNDIKAKHWELFENIGVPTKKWENWKYTPLSRVENYSFNMSKGSETHIEENQSFLQININDARLSSKLDLPN